MQPETKKKLIAGAVVLGLLVASFSAGRFSAPRVVETKEVEKLVWNDVTVEDLTKSYYTAKAETKTVYKNIITTITVTPDAGTTTTIADNSVEHIGSTENTGLNERNASTIKREGGSEKTAVKTVTVQPQWEVGVQVGASLVQPALPITGPLVIGAEVQYRIKGGVKAGLWGNTVGAGGAVVSLEF